MNSIKIAKKLLKIAKELLAVNPYEKKDKLKPVDLVSVWNEDWPDIIERVIAILQLRDAITNDISKVQELKEKVKTLFQNTRDKMTKASNITDHIDTINASAKLWELSNKKTTKDAAIKQLLEQKKAVTWYDARFSSMESGFLEELHRIDHAMQLAGFLQNSEASAEELSHFLGLSQYEFDSLANGLAPAFEKALEEHGFHCLMGHTERPSYKVVYQEDENVVKEFIEKHKKSCMKNINIAIQKFQLCAKNSRMIIVKLDKKLTDLEKANGTVSQYSDVLLQTSFTNAAFDRALIKEFEQATNGLGRVPANIEGTDNNVKTASVWDSIKEWFGNFKEWFGKLKSCFNTMSNSLKTLFSNSENNDTTDNSTEFINNFKAIVNVSEANNEK